MTKCRELNADLVTAAAKVESVAQDSYANDQAMELNNKELEQAWETINEYRDQEKNLKDEITTLQEDISDLNDRIREAAAAPEDQEDITDLLDEKAALQGKLDEATDEVMELRGQVDAVRAKQIGAEKERDAATEEVSTLNDAMARAKGDHEKETRKKVALERETALLQHDLNAAEKQINAKQSAIGEHQEELGKVQKRVAAAGKEIEKLKQGAEALVQNNARLERQRDNTIAELDRAKDDIHTGKRQLKEKEAEMQRIKKELKVSDQLRLEMEAKRNTMSTDNVGLQRDLEALKKQAEQDRKALESITRERDMLQKKSLVAGSETEAQRELVKQQASRVKSLGQDVAVFKAEARDQRRAIHSLEKDRDRFVADAASSSASCLQVRCCAACPFYRSGVFVQERVRLDNLILHAAPSWLEGNTPCRRGSHPSTTHVHCLLGS
jgi:chromosome segregation ATPase